MPALTQPVVGIDGCARPFDVRPLDRQGVGVGHVQVGGARRPQRVVVGHDRRVQLDADAGGDALCPVVRHAGRLTR
jgi:hypothetical protein